jgi:peptide/nickel transport system permease protein
MLTNAQELIASAPMLAIYPGAMIFITVMSCNLLADSLHGWVDPRLTPRKG